MLQYATVSNELLELLKALQNIPEFAKLRLVGGTSLALQFGHRKSVDIDLFGELNIDNYEISQLLSNLGSVTKLKESKNINIYVINNIKVDFVNYNYPWIDDCIVIDGLKLAKPKDIAAMKLNAVMGRGTKKDFIDLYFLLQNYSLAEVLDFYETKYHDGSVFMVLKSLTYFNDADMNESPFMIDKTSWNKIKNYISSVTKTYLESI